MTVDTSQYIDFELLKALIEKYKGMSLAEMDEVIFGEIRKRENDSSNNVSDSTNHSVV